MQDRRYRVLSVIGTRPEAIKMAPVLLEMRRHPAHLHPILVSTGQHREMLRQSLESFGLHPDVDLALMMPDQSLAGLADRAFRAVTETLVSLEPDLVLVQGDTTTACAAAVAAHRLGLPVGHVEAGLRSHDWRNPFPEEMNRCAISAVAELHFAPTPHALRALREEGVEGRLECTGNPVVDALRTVSATGSWNDAALADLDFDRRRVLLLTVHRRESHGQALRDVCRAVRALVRRFPDVEVVFPVHPSPHVRGPVEHELGAEPRVHLRPPATHADLVRLLRRCRLVLTDSGGITEEAPSFGTPVLVLRDVTERPEAVEAGAARLVGTRPERIVAEAARLLTDDEAYAAMARAPNPFGDGRAAERIVAGLRAFLDARGARPEPALLYG